MKPLGYVVIEWNQASGLPRVCADWLLDSTEEAGEEVAEFERRTAEMGRREHYSIAEVREVAA